MEKAPAKAVLGKASIPLAKIERGKKIKICSFDGGKGVYRRLLSLGVIPGNEAEVVSIHPWGGPVVLKIGDAQLAMGRGLAGKVQVREL